MTVAALVLSIVALLVAAISAGYTRRQAVAAEDTRAIETDRRHAELAPVLVAEYVEAQRMHGGERPGIWLTNRGPLDLERAEVEALRPPRSGEAVIEGIYDPGTGETASNQVTGYLRRGDTWTALEIIPIVDEWTDGQRPQRGGRVALRCTCHAAGHSPWTVVVDVEIPHGPTISIW